MLLMKKYKTVLLISGTQCLPEFTISRKRQLFSFSYLLQWFTMITSTFDTKNNQCPCAFLGWLLYIFHHCTILSSIYSILILDSNVMFIENEETNPIPIIGFEQFHSARVQIIKLKNIPHISHIW